MAISQQKKNLLKAEERRLESQIKLHRHLYYNKQPRISDQAFDSLVERLKQINPDNDVLKEVGAPADSGWQKVPHILPMTSLANAMSVQEFFSKFPQMKGKAYVIEDKFDGLSVELIYENGILVQALTRGDGAVGEDITINVKKMKFVKETLKDKISAAIRGEIMMLKSDFEALNNLGAKTYANPRNAASGISKRFDGRHSEYLSIVVYDMVSKDKTFSWETEKMDYLANNLGLVTANYRLTTMKEVVNIRQQYMDRIRDSLPYLIDGLVIKLNSIQTQKDLGSHSNGDPKGQIAFKFDAKGVATTLKDITYEVGRTGIITPNAVFEPVEIDGTMVKAASIHNADEIERLKIGIGDTVLVVKAGEIIPKITEVIESKGKSAKIPTECPACGGSIVKDGAYLKCNNDDCSGQELRRLRHWIDLMKKRHGLENIGESLIEQLNSSGLVHDPADFYKLTVDDIMSLERTGKKSAKKLVKGLAKCKEIDGITLLAGLGISALGTSMAEIILDEHEFDTLFDISKHDLSKIAGIGDSRAEAIIDGLNERKPLIEKLKAQGVKIKQVEAPEVVSTSLAGKSFQVTGTLTKINPETNKNYKREEFYNVVIANGGEVKKVKKGLDYLIVCRASSNKITKAEKLGIEVLNETTFWNMIE